VCSLMCFCVGVRSPLSDGADGFPSNNLMVSPCAFVPSGSGGLVWGRGTVLPPLVVEGKRKGFPSPTGVRKGVLHIPSLGGTVSSR